MKTREAITVTFDDWTQVPDSANLDAAFMSNESHVGLGIWFQLADTKPTELDGHTLPNADWFTFDTSDGSSVWLKAKRQVREGEVCRVRLSA